MIRTTAARTFAAACVALGCAACGHEEPYDKPLTPVRVEAAGPSGSGSGLRYSAAIIPVHAVPASFKVPGYIDSIATVSGTGTGSRLLQEGDRVRKGQVLARLRTDDFTVKVRQARAQQAEVEAAFVQARQGHDRATALYEKKSVTRGDYDAARAAYEAVLAKRDGVKAVIAEAENALADAVLRSPLDGTIIKRMAEAGALVGPGTPGFVVADTTSVKVLFGAPQLVIRRLKQGQPLSISTDTYPGESFSGRISSLAPAAEPGSLVFDVEVTVPNRDGRLKPGMVASLEIAGEEAAPEIAIPLAAIIRSPVKTGGYAVFVVEDRDGRTYARMRDVGLGRMISNGVAVTNGLRAGERVIVTGAKIVADGEAVEILR
jgi:multidrug efflux system membrane fusion protein